MTSIDVESFPVEGSDSGPILEVNDLVTSFTTPRGRLTAVNHVSFSLDRGETLGVVGESGSGKTVLSRSILNLLPSMGLEQSGSVVFEGTDMLTASTDVLRTLWGARIAMIFQDPMSSLNPVVRIERQITETLRLHLKMDRQEAKATAVALLDQVGIPSPAERVRNYPYQLSGGMRQRVMIAIAIACSPRLVLADEPTTSLDVTVQAQILDLLAAMKAERNMSMILVSHDLGVVATRADRIAVMYGGRIVEIAPTKTLFASMAMPYTQALIGSTPRISQASHVRLTAIDGRPPDLVNPPKGCAFAPRCPYATDQCRNDVPPLVAARNDESHLYACWNPLSGSGGTVTTQGGAAS
jgi:oligopeptide/dipeptide ABC transporter ATP-binding protein